MHQEFNLNLSLSKTFFVASHNLRTQDSHLVFSEVAIYDFKVNVYQNQ